MRIVRLEAQNIKRLKAVEITPDGNIVQITGANGSGKSSVLDSIFYCLAGTKEIPSKPIRTGTQKATIRLDLGEVVVTRKFSESGTQLMVEGEKGARFPSPQRLLDELLGTLTFDPLAFSRMDARKQLDTLRGMVKLDVYIDDLDRQNAADFAKRTDVTRRAKALESQSAAFPVAPNLPDAPIDVSALLEELQAAGRHNQQSEHIKAEVGYRTRHIGELRERVMQIKAAIKSLEQDIKNLDAEIAKDEGLIKQEVPAEIDTTAIRQKVEAARTINLQLDSKAKRDALAKEAQYLVDSANRLTKAIQDRQDAKQKAIAEASMPVPGLSFGEGEILFDGLPFNQASDAEQLRVSVAIAMAANPKLRVLRIKDGSLLDEKSLALIAGMADEKEFQVWIESVNTSGQVGIYMEDGAVRKVNHKSA